MKKYTIVLLIICLCASMLQVAATENSIVFQEETGVIGESVYRAVPSVSQYGLIINDSEIDLSLTPMVVYDDRTYLPMRKICNLFGIGSENILWNNETSVATLHIGENEFSYEFWTGKGYINGELDNGSEPLFVDYNGSVYMQVRGFASYLEVAVDWDSVKKAVVLTKEGIDIPWESIKKAPRARQYTAEEYELLARLVEAEAKDQVYIGRVAVANVVLNRVDSDEFPDTIEAVIYEKNQFSVVKNGEINKAATEESYRAAKEALDGRFVVDGLFFNMIGLNSYAKKNREFECTIDSHDFYY